MIPKFDRVPEPGREGQRKLTITRSSIPELPVGSDFTAEVNYDDGATIEGTPVNRASQTEYLAASGITTGTSSIFNLAQEGFELFDGAPIRIKFHTNTVAPFTLNVNFTGAIPVSDAINNDKANYSINTWAFLIYSATLNKWIIQGTTASDKAPLESPIFTGTPVAPADTDYGVARIRNIYAGTDDMTAGTTTLASGTIYLVYE